MNEIALQNAALTMTSREIAELTGKDHRNVTADVRAMLLTLEIDVLKSQHIWKDSAGREQVEYVLDRELTYTLLTGYDAKARYKVVKRWLALEKTAVEEASERLEASQGALSIAYAGRKQLQLQLDRLELEKASRQALVEDSKLVKVTSVRLQLAASQKMVKAQADSMQKLSAYKAEVIADLHKKLEAAKSKNGMRYV